MCSYFNHYYISINSKSIYELNYVYCCTLLHFQEQIKRPIALSVRPPINLYISQFLTLVRSFHYALPIAHHDDMQHWYLLEVWKGTEARLVLSVGLELREFKEPPVFGEFKVDSFNISKFNHRFIPTKWSLCTQFKGTVKLNFWLFFQWILTLWHIVRLI